MNLQVKHYPLHFKRPSGTSRGIMQVKNSWIIQIWRDETPEIKGTGECSVIEGLSPDYISIEQYEAAILEAFQKWKTLGFTSNVDFLSNYPSIQFGFETALLDLKNGGKGIMFNNAFHQGELKIPINGLIWMGSPEFMQEQIREKIADGYTTIKMKIGAIDFETELNLLQSIREKFSDKEITLRVDANGAFSPEEAWEKLEKLAQFDIHSIEQPIKAGQWEAMAKLCKNSKVPIALDEELIGVNDRKQKINLLETIQPDYIILKPSLHGGISGTQEWIDLAEAKRIPWWMTSALESNIGLNAICQLTAEYPNSLPQGLGTGSLYSNNIPLDLIVEQGYIYCKK